MNANVKTPVRDALAELERLNGEVARLNIWLRTKANAPAQQPWRRADLSGHPPVPATSLSAGVHTVPCLWKWRDIEPYLRKVADLCPIELTERQQLHLRNPGLGGSLRIANSIRVAISIYKPGDAAPLHVHSPNASRTIFSEHGGHSIVEGERCQAERGDVIFTPNGTWHGHGNHDAEPVIWMDVLDWPLMEFLDAIWIDDSVPMNAVDSDQLSGYSRAVYGRGGLAPRFERQGRGTGRKVTPVFQYHGRDLRALLDDIVAFGIDAFDGATVEMVNPRTGGPAFPGLSYRAHRFPAGATTRDFRHTASTVYCVMNGCGRSIVGDATFEWEPNDIFVVPNHVWRRHEIDAGSDATLYAVSDAPLLEHLGQYYCQGRKEDGTVTELDSRERG